MIPKRMDLAAWRQALQPRRRLALSPSWPTTVRSLLQLFAACLIDRVVESVRPTVAIERSVLVVGYPGFLVSW